MFNVVVSHGRLLHSWNRVPRKESRCLSSSLEMAFLTVFIPNVEEPLLSAYNAVRVEWAVAQIQRGREGTRCVWNTQVQSVTFFVLELNARDPEGNTLLRHLSGTKFVTYSWFTGGVKNWNALVCLFVFGKHPAEQPDTSFPQSFGTWRVSTLLASIFERCN